MRNKLASGIIRLLAAWGLLLPLTACTAAQSSEAETVQEKEPIYEYTGENVGQPAVETAEVFESGTDELPVETAYEADADTLTETEPLIVEVTIDKDGVYTTKEDVSLYLYTYGELPQNFITKKEAQALGWTGGSLESYAPGCCIGGSYFGNYEGNLPEKEGRSYTECDIDTVGSSSRGAKRIIFSNDGLIYYTGDHYESFELLYGEP